MRCKIFNKKGDFKMTARKTERGFTLLEILVVITLILIIAGIALPRFAGVTDEGRKAKAKGELKTLQTGLESYLLNSTSTVPATYAALKTALEAATPRLVGEMDDFVDPFGATATTGYSYAKSTNNKYYVLYSLGVDKAADITGITDTGAITPDDPDDDIFVTNGQLAV